MNPTLNYAWFKRDTYFPEPIQRFSENVQRHIPDDYTVQEDAKHWETNPLYQRVLRPLILSIREHPVKPVLFGVFLDDAGPFIYAGCIVITMNAKIPSQGGETVDVPFTFHFSFTDSQEYNCKFEEVKLWDITLGTTTDFVQNAPTTTEEEFKSGWLNYYKDWWR